MDLAWGSPLLTLPCSLTAGQVRNSRVCDPQNLKTLFLEMVFKLMRQGFVPYKSTREVIRWAQLYWTSEPRLGGADSALCRGTLMFLPQRWEPPEFWVSFLGDNLT